jgi:hypothetical protein
MIKQVRKLALSRETLRTMDAPGLGAAHGGVGQVQPALDTDDLLPRTQLCNTRFCNSGQCFVTAACPVFSHGGCTEPTFTF